jgi:hypothetical protein
MGMPLVLQKASATSSALSPPFQHSASSFSPAVPVSSVTVVL